MAKALSLFLFVSRFLPGEELPDSCTVELIPERVQDGVEDRRRLGQHRKDLEDQTTIINTEMSELHTMIFQAN